MSELNLDTMTFDKLKEQADILNIEYRGNIGEETLRNRIREFLGELPEDQEPPESQLKPIAPARGDKMVTIRIEESETDSQPVPAGLNGEIIRIRRGEDVKIPERFLGSLRDAKQQVQDPKTGVWRTVQTYPFSVLG